MRPLLATLAAVLLLAAPAAAESPSLTGRDARAALVSWSLNHGMEEATVKRCWRMDAATLKCQMVETGQWNEDLRAEAVWSVYRATRRPDGRIGVVWLDFVAEWN